MNFLNDEIVIIAYSPPLVDITHFQHPRAEVLVYQGYRGLVGFYFPSALHRDFSLVRLSTLMLLSAP